MALNRVFLLGDFESNSGPGVANRGLLKTFEMSKEIKIQHSSAKGDLNRIIEACNRIRKTDVLIICSKSNINYIAIKIAKICHKKILYIVHGLSSYEAIIANPNLTQKEYEKIVKYEKFIFSNTDKIVCVSPKAREIFNSKYPEFAEKSDYIYNCVDFSTVKHNKKVDRKGVLSVGGGMRQKGNLTVAKAVNELEVQQEYYVVGKEAEEGAKIKKYSNVVWFDSLSREGIQNLMEKMDIYVQNSTFETFGLAVIEALFSGCSLLISNNVGALTLFSNLKEDDIIYDTDDKDEIKRKIQNLLSNGNNKRLTNGFKKECVTHEWQLRKLLKIIRSVEDGYSTNTDI